MNTENLRKAQDGKYKIESLIKLNTYYNAEYRVTQTDVDMANAYVSLIEKTRSNVTPKAGDILRYTNQHGDYYPFAHIEDNDGDVCNICENPNVSFISPKADGISCNTGGGAWDDLQTGNLKYIGKKQKYFHDWGHAGACGNGSVYFTAEVSVWEYVHPQPLYRGYTTEKWCKLYLTYVSEDKRKDNDGYLYTSMNGVAFRTEADFQKFLSERKGEVFKGNWKNQSVVWCYTELQKQVSQEEFDALDLPETSTYCNGEQPAKIMYDDENKIAIYYFVMPDRTLR